MRLFTCLRPTAAALDHLAAALSKEHSPVERWHVTLAFLGEVDDPAPVVAALDRVDVAPVQLSLAGAGRFGRAEWAGVAGDLDGLRRLAVEVQRACGVQRERPWVPHLTVGRTPVPPAYRGPSFVVDEVELVRSRLGRTVEHEVLHRVRR